MAAARTYEIFTIYNYSGRNLDSERMLRAWINQTYCALIASEGRISRIRIISETGGIDNQFRESLKNAISNFSAESKIIFETNDAPRLVSGDANNSPQKFRQWQFAVYKLHTLCNQNSPYIFLDLDAILIAPKNILNLVRAADTQPITGFNHQIVPMHTAQFPFRFLNSGVLAVSDPHFLKYETVSVTPLNTWCPGGDDDQIRLWNYFRNIGYEYVNPALPDARWNAFGPHKVQISHGAKSIPFGPGFHIETVTTGLPLAEENGIPICVLHYWWRTKPWMLPCDIYETIATKADLVFGAEVRKYRYTDIHFATPTELIINASVTDGSDTFDPSLPIGVGWKFAAELTQAEQEKILFKARKSLAQRSVLLHIGFEVSTDRHRRGNSKVNRKIVEYNLAKNNYVNVGGSAPFNKFISDISDSVFVVSPEGNGVDCHRHYETLVMGAIPIIEDNPLMKEKLKDLPILWTSQAYSEITEQYLLREKDRIIAELESGKYNKRISSILRTSSYTSEQQDTLNKRSNYWLRTFNEGKRSKDKIIETSSATKVVTAPTFIPNIPLMATIHQCNEHLKKSLSSKTKLSNTVAGIVKGIAETLDSIAETGSNPPRKEFNFLLDSYENYFSADKIRFSPSGIQVMDINDPYYARFENDNLESSWNQIYTRIKGIIESELFLVEDSNGSTSGKICMAEIGVGRGGLAKFLMDTMGKSFFHYFSVDPHIANYDPRDGFCRQYPCQEDFSAMRAFVKLILSPYASNCALINMRGEDFGLLMDDKSFDCVYIDANHNYESVKACIDTWKNKVRPGGCLIFNEAFGCQFPGVKRAIDEFISEWSVSNSTSLFLKRDSGINNIGYIVMPNVIGNRDIVARNNEMLKNLQQISQKNNLSSTIKVTFEKAQQDLKNNLLQLINQRDSAYTSNFSRPKITVFCAVWSKDPKRWQLLKQHQACLDKQTVPIERIYVFDGGDSAPSWLKGRHVFYDKNLTIYEAWDAAITAAKTSYVMNLNLDDRLCPKAAEIMELILDSGADLVSGEWLIEFSQKDTNRACNEDTRLVEAFFNPRWPPINEDLRLILGSGCNMRGTFGPSTAWKRSLHDIYGPYPTKFISGEKIKSVADCIWWNVLAMNETKIVRLPIIIGRYYCHPSEQAEFRTDLTQENIMKIEYIQHEKRKLLMTKK